MTISAALGLLARSTLAVFLGAFSLLAITAPARAQVMEIVKDFESAASYPMSSLIVGADGYLYGTTYRGGDFNEGSVFKIAVNGSNFSILKSLRCGAASNGCLPLAGLVQGLDGYLYGTTSLGGASDEGTIFRIAADGSGFAVLRSFQCGISGDGCSPQSGLLQGSDGMLYGTTAFGGSGDGGTIFKLSPSGSSFAVPRSFRCDQPTDGCHSAGKLLQASNGFLYGTSYHGGAHNQGSVYRLAPDGNGFTLLKSFQCAVAINGCMPLAGLIQANNGMLYGTTQQGGAVDEGTLFRLSGDGSDFLVIHSFQCGQAASGCLPVAGVVQLGDGNLYGTTTFGGANAEGTLYRIAPDATNFTVLDRFACDGDDGCKPQAQLTVVPNGYLYSTTSAGGKFGGGTIFRLPAPAASSTSSNTAISTGPVAAVIGPTLTVNPNTAPRGANVTAVWSGIVNPTAKDWVGLYPAGSGNSAYRTWIYVNCSTSAGAVGKATGSCPLTLPLNLENGTYELRLLANNGFTVLAKSGSLVVGNPVTSAAASISVTPSAVKKGEFVTVAWSGLANAAAKDWIGLYPAGAPTSSYLTWLYVSCSTTANSARATGTCNLLVAPSVPPGDYQVKLLGNNGYGVIATSRNFTIEPAEQSATLSATPNQVRRGGLVNVAWSGIDSPTAKDWVALYAQGDPNSSYLTWAYVSCSTTATTAKPAGSCALEIPATASPGIYQLRLLGNNGFNALVTSSSFTVQ